MRHHTVRCRVDPVLAPDQFSVARPLRPEDLDRRVTRQSIYPSLPAPNGIPWSEYVRTHRNRPQSISSSTEALDSDHARYVTRKIAQHARSMATHTRSLPTDSPVPYFQPVERGYMSEGSQEGVYATPYVDPSEHTINIGGTDYHSEITETDRVSTFTGLDDYDTLFPVRHGRGALDPAPRVGDQLTTTSLGIPPPIAGLELINPMERVMPIRVEVHPSQGEQISLIPEMLKSQVGPPSSDIIGEGVAIFTDMTETILDILDKQISMSPGSQQQAKGNDNQTKLVKGKEPKASPQKEDYPDLFLPIRENYRISDHFHGYLDSLSMDNNPMVLVKLDNLSYRYGMSIYAVDRVNSSMYGKFSIGYKMILERAMVIPQYQHTTMKDEYEPGYDNTLLGITNIATPIAKSTPVTQASHVPMTKTGLDIVRPMSSERARAAYLESQIRNIDSVRLPSKVSSMEEEINLTRRINTFCKE